MSTDWLDVSDTTPRIAYTATASQTAFVVPFAFFDDADLLVYQNATLLTLATHYTVSGAESDAGGTVTLLSGATVGDKIMIVRDVAIVQTTHIPPSGPLDIPAVNIQFSKLIAIAQQLSDEIDRSMRLSVTDPTVSMTLPLAAVRANQMLGFDSSGAPTPAQPSNALVSAAMQPIVAAATLITAQGLLGISNGIVPLAVSTGISVTSVFKRIVATGPITLTLSRANTFFNGAGFWVDVTGGDVTLAINANDHFLDKSAGVALVLPSGTSGFISTDAAAAGLWVASLGATSSTVLAQSSGDIYGLTIANNASDPVNDIDIGTGKATDSTNAISISLTSLITKRLDVTWVVGSGNGGLDTGSIGNGTYHVFIIQRPDTGVVDALFSLSPSAPTMPTNYIYKRRIASIIRVAGTILAFRQFGDMFKLSVPVLDRNSISAATDSLLTLTVPNGIKVNPIIVADISQTTAGSSGQLFDDADVLTATVAIARSTLAGEVAVGQTQACVTNTASQLRYTFFLSGTVGSARITTLGWTDGRGR
jgi:hypothetical protein